MCAAGEAPLVFVEHLAVCPIAQHSAWGGVARVWVVFVFVLWARRKSGVTKLKLLRPAAFAMLLLLLAPSPVLAEAASHEADVRAAVESFGRAFAEADVPTLEAFLTDTYVHVNGRTDNVLNRDEWLSWVKTRRTELETGDLVVSEYGIEDLEVDLYGEAAVVTGVVHSKVSRNGDPFENRIRFTNVWVLEGAAWRRAAFHDSAVLDPKD